MNPFSRILLLGTIGVTAYFFVHKNRHAIDWTEAPIQTDSKTVAPVAASPDGASTTAFRPVRAQKPLDPLAELKISLRLKLRQWQESEANAPDDEEGRDLLMQEMLAQVTDGNVAEIVQSLSPEEMNTPFGNGALHHWMQVEPVAASNWLASRPETTEEQILTVADGWIGKGDDLKQYIEQLPDTAWKQRFLQAASSETSLQDPREAIRLAQELTPGGAQTNLLRSVACSWISTDPDAALEWVANVKDPTLREQLIASAAQSYALTDPVQAATWLVSEIKSDDIAREAALNILETWVATDPTGAANWVSRFPEGDLKMAAVKIVSNHWHQTDPNAAIAWIKNMPHDK